jgi:hypothetical protein
MRGVGVSGRVIAPVAISLLALLLGCTRPMLPHEIREEPVELRVVSSVWPGEMDGRPVISRVVTPDAIEVLRGRVSESIVAHELVHIEQWRQMGARFPVEYARQFVLYGYWDAPLEVDARARSTDPHFRDWAWELIERCGEPCRE